MLQYIGYIVFGNNERVRESNFYQRRKYIHHKHYLNDITLNLIERILLLYLCRSNIVANLI